MSATSATDALWADPDSVLDSLPQFLQAVRQTLHCVADRDGHVCDFDALAAWLRELPLAEDEYVLASNRLDNARWYFLHGEQRAAKYELTMLVRRTARTLNRA